ncbi:class I SAM-dependent methyltransferase [Kribbella sp. NPDC051952]|uniref:class I SAM-dependent methyltransferase n=1 Tax=Kribbella sp. NPDC051952 TaxID=3154851 RepID=UPI00343F91EC
MNATEWNFEWDPTLYAGSAEHYAVGRMAYPVALAEAVRDELGLDGTGRLLDVGCGPGALTLLFAPYVEEVVGVDADGDMLKTAARRAEQAGIDNTSWRQLRAEELPADLGTFRVVMFAQSFHWMDRSLVADRVRGMLTPDGAWVHIGATTHRGLDGTNDLPHPRPPWNAIDELVARYLGPVRRAGQGVAPSGTRPGEEDVMRAAGYSGPTRIVVGGNEIEERTVDDIVASVFSLSSSTPHLFGAELSAFETDLRALLTEAADDNRFSEQRREIEAVIWRDVR